MQASININANLRPLPYFQYFNGAHSRYIPVGDYFCF